MEDLRGYWRDRCWQGRGYGDGGDLQQVPTFVIMRKVFTILLLVRDATSGELSVRVMRTVSAPRAGRTTAIRCWRTSSRRIRRGRSRGNWKCPDGWTFARWNCCTRTAVVSPTSPCGQSLVRGMRRMFSV